METDTEWNHDKRGSITLPPHIIDSRAKARELAAADEEDPAERTLTGKIPGRIRPLQTHDA